MLRLMREANLLSPHRVPQKPPCEHKGRIVTSEPNHMWGADGARVLTTGDGWGWVFARARALESGGHGMARH